MNYGVDQNFAKFLQILMIKFPANLANKSEFLRSFSMSIAVMETGKSLILSLHYKIYVSYNIFSSKVIQSVYRGETEGTAPSLSLGTI